MTRQKYSIFSLVSYRDFDINNVNLEFSISITTGFMTAKCFDLALLFQHKA